MHPSDFIELRRDIHQNPEVSGEEKETKQRIRDFISKFNPDDIIEVGKYGLIFVYRGTKSGSSIMIRSEMDALPIQEINSFPHKSKTDGVSHKCGHDGHMAILANVAYRLSKKRLNKGTCYLLYQPAEEIGEGAKEVYNDSAFQQLRVDRILALHNLPGFPKKSVVVKDGAFTPAVSSIAVKFYGKTSHAAEPEKGLNPAATIAEFLTKSLSVAQEDPTQPDFFLVTPIYMTLGDKNYGISAGYGEVHLTLRSMESELLNKQSEKIESFAREIGKAAGLKVEMSCLQDFKANINQSSIVEDIRAAAQTLNLDLKELKTPMKWGEDFGLFSEHIPGAMFGLGGGEDCPALHNPDYDFPDELIEIGGSMFETLTRNFLED